MNGREVAGIVMLFFERGRTYINLVNTFLIMLLTIRSYGVNDLLALPFLVALLIGSIAFGYFDFKYGFWKSQTKFSTSKINPFFQKLEKDIEEIKEAVKA